jgi:hypothetical protein
MFPLLDDSGGTVMILARFCEGCTEEVTSKAPYFPQSRCLVAVNSL